MESLLKSVLGDASVWEILTYLKNVTIFVLCITIAISVIFIVAGGLYVHHENFLGSLFRRVLYFQSSCMVLVHDKRHGWCISLSLFYWSYAVSPQKKRIFLLKILRYFVSATSAGLHTEFIYATGAW